MSPHVSGVLTAHKSGLFRSLWYVGVFSVLSGAGGAVAILPAYRGSYIEAM